jgi:hypothetical protein
MNAEPIYEAADDSAPLPPGLSIHAHDISEGPAFARLCHNCGEHFRWSEDAPGPDLFELHFIHSETSPLRRCLDTDELQSLRWHKTKGSATKRSHWTVDMLSIIAPGNIGRTATVRRERELYEQAVERGDDPRQLPASVVQHRKEYSIGAPYAHLLDRLMIVEGRGVIPSATTVARPAVAAEAPPSRPVKQRASLRNARQRGRYLDCTACALRFLDADTFKAHAIGGKSPRCRTAEALKAANMVADRVNGRQVWRLWAPPAVARP